MTIVCFKAFRNVILLLMLAFLSSQAYAGHLFTQASANTPINLTAGQGIQITQQTFEGSSAGGNISLNFNGDWSAGDAIKLTIGSWTQTISYDSPLSGTTQNSSFMVVYDPTLAAAGITQAPNTQWLVIATNGTFTFTGYRIYIADGTLNGTGAAPINQSQVVDANSLTGGVFVPVASRNEAGLAAVLDQLRGTATGQLGLVIAAMGAMTDESRALALKLISPERSQVLEQSAVSTASSALDTVQIRLDAIRTGVGLEALQPKNVSFHHDGSNDGTQTGLSSGDGELNRNFWAKAFGGKADQDSRGGFAGSDSTVYGMMVGADHVLENDWLIGAALAYARTDVNMSDYRHGDGADIDTYQLTGYFGKTFDRWYLDGMLTYAYQRYDTSRNTHLTGIADGDFSGSTYGLRLIAGMPIPLSGTITFTPFGGVEAYHISQSSYTEKGAGVLSLQVSSNDTDRIRSILGGELATLRKLDDGGVLRPSLKMSWRHEFHDDGINSAAALVGGGGAFETIGQEVNQDVYGLSAKVSWYKTERLSLTFELGAESGDGYSSVSGQVAGSWRF